MDVTPTFSFCKKFDSPLIQDRPGQCFFVKKTCNSESLSSRISKRPVTHCIEQLDCACANCSCIARLGLCKCQQHFSIPDLWSRISSIGNITIFCSVITASILRKQ